MVPLLAACGVLLAGLAVIGWRAPVARRVAVRRLRRRGRDGLLVIAGGALGTALITGSLLIGDTLQASLTDRATLRLGPVDVVVRSFAPVIADAVATTLEFDPPPDADGILPVAATDGTLATTGGQGPRAVVPAIRIIEVDFAAAQAFGGDPSATGISGSTPGPDGVVLTTDLADRLGVTAGATVEVFAYGRSRPLTVERLLAPRGLAGYSTGFDPVALNAFVGPDVVAQLAYDPEFPPAAAPPDALVLISADGDVLSGAQRSDALVEQLRSRFSTLEGFDIAAVKREALDAAAQDAASYAALFTSLAAFAVLAGVALLGNLFVMLADDRRTESGVLRAIGLRRRGVWATLVLEGGALAAAGALVGSVVGVAVARLLVAVGGGALEGVQRAGVDLRFAVRPSTVLVGALAGMLVAVAAVTVSATAAGRRSVVGAIQDLPQSRPAVRGTHRAFWAAVAGAVALAAATIVASQRSDDVGRLALPSLTLCAFAFAALLRHPVAGRGRSGRRAATGVAVAVLVWSVAALRLLDVDDTDVAVFVVQGVALTLAGVVVLAGQSARIGRVLARAPGRAGFVLRLATTYPSARAGRTGATLATYSLVVYTLVFSSLLSSFFSSQIDQLVDDEAGGADLLVTTGTSAPVSTAALTAVDGVAAAASTAWTVAEFRVGAAGPYQPWALSGFDEGLLAMGPPRIDRWDTATYPDQGAVWRAVLGDPGLAVADAAFLQRGGGPPQDNVAVGDVLDVRGPGTDTPTRLRVVAISTAGTAFSGVMVSQPTALLVDPKGVANRHHVAVAEGVDASTVGRGLERAFLPNGLRARTFAAVVAEALADQEAFFDLIEGYLALGLLVGVAGIGAVAARAVRERRRELAVLRALGVDRATLRAIVLSESGLVALQGTALGGATALLGGYQLVSNTRVFGTAGAFSVPWLLLAALLGATVLTASLVSLVTAVRASHRDPAADLGERMG